MLVLLYYIETMKHKVFLLFFFSVLFGVTDAQIPIGYYDGAEGLNGQQLKSALYNIIKGHTEYPYTSTSTDTWDILKETDRDSANPDNVILLYSGWSVDAEQEYNNAQGWSREHVWAKSHGDFGTDLGAGTDAHHLRPADISVNSARSNLDFDNGGTLYVDGDGVTECLKDGDSWEPRDAVKGDVARMLFYMAVRYEGENGEPDLELVDEVDTYDPTLVGIGYHGKLSTLLEWHTADPVDSFEIKRNNIIYSYQKNRNPFIDHPEYVNLIWVITGTGRIDVNDQIRVFPNPANDKIKLQLNSINHLHFELFNSTGELVISKHIDKTSEISVSQLNAGLYLIRVSKGNLVFYTSKISLN